MDNAEYNETFRLTTHCNTLQHTATHCNTLQYTAMHCNTLQHTATHCNTLADFEDELGDAEYKRLLDLQYKFEKQLLLFHKTRQTSCVHGGVGGVEN